MGTTAYVAVDVQNDFVEGGALGVDGGKAVAQRIRTFLEQHGSAFSKIVATRDWHIDPGNHFDTWPVHCVANTPGAEFEANVQQVLDEYPNNSVVVSKGMYSDGYSGFDGTDLDRQHPLNIVLADANVSTVVVGGIATDYCVLATALDAVGRSELDVVVLTDHIAGVEAATSEAALAKMADAGIILMTSDEFIAELGK